MGGLRHQSRYAAMKHGVIFPLGKLGSPSARTCIKRSIGIPDPSRRAPLPPSCGHPATQVVMYTAASVVAKAAPGRVARPAHWPRRGPGPPVDRRPLPCRDDARLTDTGLGTWELQRSSRKAMARSLTLAKREDSPAPCSGTPHLGPRANDGDRRAGLPSEGCHRCGSFPLGAGRDGGHPYQAARLVRPL